MRRHLLLKGFSGISFGLFLLASTTPCHAEDHDADVDAAGFDGGELDAGQLDAGPAVDATVEAASPEVLDASAADAAPRDGSSDGSKEGGSRDAASDGASDGPPPKYLPEGGAAGLVSDGTSCAVGRPRRDALASSLPIFGLVALARTLRRRRRSPS